MHEEGYGLHNRLKHVEELLGGTWVNFERHIVAHSLGSSKEGNLRVFRHLQEDREGWGFSFDVLDKGIADVGGPKVLRQERRYRYLDLPVPAEGQKHTPGIVDELIEAGLQSRDG